MIIVERAAAYCGWGRGLTRGVEAPKPKERHAITEYNTSRLIKDPSPQHPASKVKTVFYELLL